jgi:hypothetical protein
MKPYTVILLNPEDYQEDEGLSSFMTVTSTSPHNAALSAQMLAADRLRGVHPTDLKLIAVYEGVIHTELQHEDL